MPKFTLAWPARPTLLALLPLLPLSALAQQALPPVQIQGRSDGALSEDSALKRVVGAAELTRMNDARLVDALARLSGLSVEPGRPGQGDQLSLRGLGAGRTQLLLNGQPARLSPGARIYNTNNSLVMSSSLAPSGNTASKVRNIPANSDASPFCCQSMNSGDR